MNTDSNSLSVSIATAKTQAVFGGSLALEITYRNCGNEPLTIAEPPRTRSMRLEVTNERSETETVAFGRKTIVAVGDRTSVIVDEPRDINIAYGDEYRCGEDVLRRWIELLPPGNFKIRVIDESNEEANLVSNQLQISVAIATRSAPALLQILADEDARLDVREFARDWIERIRGKKMGLTLFEPTPEQKAQNRTAIEQVKAWWEANKDTQDVKDWIDIINEQAGVGRSDDTE